MKEILLISFAFSIIIYIYALFICKIKKLYYIAIFLSTTSLFLTLFYLASDKFTGEGITEAVFFHVFYGLNGIQWSNFIYEILIICILLLAIISTIPISKYIYFRKNKSYFIKQKSFLIELTSIISLSFFAVGVHPATIQTASIASDFFKSIDNKTLNIELQQPTPTINSDKKKRSLVYIYAESLERTFLNKTKFPKLTPNIYNLDKNSLSFHGIGQPPLTDWTIAGMVASQCGMPLATFRANRNDLSDRENFLSGNTCLGDILKKENYNLSYIGGADIGFAGKGKFYRDHEFSDIVGLHNFQNEFGQNIPLSKWGVYDDMLFDSALKKFIDLSSKNEPFALVILTLDTHPPSGHKTPMCKSLSIKYQDGSNEMLNAVKCADWLIPNFIKKLEAVNTQDAIIVLASDHIQMNNDAIDLLNNTGTPRENLFMIRGTGISAGIINRNSTPLDIGPTILGIMGWEAESLALGRNLLLPEKTLSEKFGQSTFFEMLQHWRLALWKMWKD